MRLVYIELSRLARGAEQERRCLRAASRRKGERGGGGVRKREEMRQIILDSTTKISINYLYLPPWPLWVLGFLRTLSDMAFFGFSEFLWPLIFDMTGIEKKIKHFSFSLIWMFL